jgi:ABC-type transporter Mla MlaB component
MLKITTETHDNETTLRLEGRLAGPWIEEVSRCWQQTARPPGHSVVVDLSGLIYVDLQGRELLVRLWQQGARLKACGCLMNAMVDELTKAEKERAMKPDRDKRR